MLERAIEFGCYPETPPTYEKGTNRVGASRLQAISAILQVPISFFFEGASPTPSSTRKQAAKGPPSDFVTEFLKNADSHTLIKAFLRIKEPVVRGSIVRMVETIGGSRALASSTAHGSVFGRRIAAAAQ